MTNTRRHHRHSLSGPTSRPATRLDSPEGLPDDGVTQRSDGFLQPIAPSPLEGEGLSVETPITDESLIDVENLADLEQLLRRKILSDLEDRPDLEELLGKEESWAACCSDEE